MITDMDVVDHPERDQPWDSTERSETEVQRLDRNWLSLLQELRVVQTGVQLLTGFLLTLPFQQRFEILDTRMRAIYLATVGCSVAATVLSQASSGKHDGRVYPLTGPENLTVGDKVRAIGMAIGRELTLVDKDDAQAAAQAMWLPGVCTIEGPGVLSTVEDVTGSPARSFRQWASNHASAFR